MCKLSENGRGRNTTQFILRGGYIISSVQSLSRVRLCDPMDCSAPGLPAHHQLLELKLMSIESAMPSNIPSSVHI